MEKNEKGGIIMDSIERIKDMVYDELDKIANDG